MYITVFSLHRKTTRMLALGLAICIMLMVGAIVASANTASASFNSSCFNGYVTATGSDTGDGKTSEWTNNQYAMETTGKLFAAARTQSVTFNFNCSGSFSFDYKLTLSGQYASANVGGTEYSNLGATINNSFLADVNNTSSVEVSVQASGSSNREAYVYLSNIKFIPEHRVVLVASEGGSYTCLKNGVATTQTEFTEPGVTVTASSISASATTYTLSAAVSEENVGNYTYQGWQVSADGINWTTVDPNASTTDEWALDADGNYLFTPAADWYIRPYFVKNEIETTFQSVAGGSYTVNTSEGNLQIAEKTADSGTDQTGKEAKDWAYEITATPSSGYYLVGYKIDKGANVTPQICYISPTQSAYTFNTANGQSFTVDAAYTVYPLFAKAIDITLKAPSEGIASYTVTASLNGKTVTLPFTDPITTEQTITVPEGTTLTLSSVNLTNEDQYNFSCWTIGDNLLSVEAEAAATIQESGIEIGPLAVSSKAIYEVEGAQYSTWELAMEAAEVSTTKVAILLMNEELPTTMQENGLPDNGGDYVKPDGNGGIKYIIPDGVYLLLPHTAGDKEIGVDTITNGTTSTLKYANRKFTTDTTGMFSTTHGLNVTLTVPSSATVEVSGVLTIGGTIYSISGESIAGAPAGAHSNIQLNGTINVTSTGTLSVLGYIIGAGPINVASSGSVYQLFTIMDYRSGGYTVSAAGDGYYLAPVTGETMVSPFLRYAFLNIQVPMQISSGGNLYGYCDMFTGEAMGGAAKAQHNVTNALIIGNSDGALINLSSGATAAIVYDSSVYSTAYSAIGRTTITISGGASVGAFSLKASVAGITKDVRSDSFTFPIPYNFEVRLTAKDANTPAVYTIAKPLAFLPGATLYVGENAQLQLNGSNIVALYDGLYDHTSTGSSMAYGTVGINHYPYTSQLNKAAFNQGTAALVVDGSLMIGANVQFGGTVQTNGTGTVSVDSSASTQCTVQIGLVGRNYIGIDILNIGNEYLYAGATVRTLTAQLMNSDGVLFPMQQGETYFGVDNCAHTLDTYEYTLYTSYDKAEGTVLSISGENAEVLNARIVGSWCTVPGHDYQLTESQSSAPTCTEHGKNVYVCSACGNSYFESLDPAHTWGEDGNCKVCGVSQSSLIDLYGTSVRAGDSLGMYFYVKKEDLPNANGSKTTSGTYYAKVIHAKADGTTETVTDIEGELYQDTYYRFYFTGVAAKEMADMVYVSIYDNKDALVSNVYSESVENYAVSLLEAIGENPSGRNALLQQTLVDMLYYGAACQTYFGYNTDELATRNISTYTPSSGTISYGEDISNDDTVKAYCLDQSVTVESSLIFSFYFQNIDRTKGIDVSFTDHYGSSKSPEITVTDLGENKYRVDVHGLAVADGYAGNATISCKVTTSDGAEITAKGRISDYAKAAAEAFPDQKDVFERLMYFAASAHEYLHEVIKSA